jgi:hypothetical protein
MESFNLTYFLYGLCGWSGWEYIYHRYLMHYTNTGNFQYFLHGHHHSYPDKNSIHLPLFQYFLMLYPFYVVLQKVGGFNHNENINYTIGHLIALFIFENTHKEIHKPYWITDPNVGFRVSHMYHHKTDKNMAFCFTSPVFDILFNTFPHDKLSYNFIALLPLPIISYMFGTCVKPQISSKKTLLVGGGGSLFWHYAGKIHKKILENDKYIDEFEVVAGVSTGSMIGCFIVSKCDLITIKREAIELVKSLKTKPLMITKCLDILKEFCKKQLPEDAYKLCSGKLHIQTIHLLSCQVVCFNNFVSNDDLVDKVLKACHIPLLCNGITNDGYIDRFFNKCKMGCCESLDTEEISVCSNLIDCLKVPDENFIQDKFNKGMNE